MNRLGIIGCVATAAFCASTANAAPPPERVAFTGGTILPIVGDRIENGTVLVERGVIVAIGGEVEIPYDAFEVDCTGLVIMPGMIHPHSSDGLDVANEALPVAPFLDVGDALDPSALFFENALREGITSVHVIQANNTVIGGVSRVVHPIGLSVSEMTARADVALKLSTSPRRGSDRMVQMAQLREAFLALDDAIAKLAEAKYEEKLKEDEKPMDVGPAEARERGMALLEDRDYDELHLNLVRLRRGELGAWIYAGAAMDVAPALRVARDQGFHEQTVLVIDGDAHLAAREIADAGVRVVLPSQLFHRERDPISGELIETFVPTVFHEAGVTFALQPNPSDSFAERFLNYQAALLVRHGVPRQVALESITINPATMMGMGDRVGSLEVGKDANILVLSGDPLDFNTRVESVYIDGALAYERESDTRLQELLRLQRRQDNGASGPARSNNSNNSNSNNNNNNNNDDSDDNDRARNGRNDANNRSNQE
ncbi:MAG: hypothetical protein EA378_07950 [Phycisphaerales bacterium]|nr:MAG: hypothetical protein EA378_07950 [Phycisphaerales bacterium]